MLLVVVVLLAVSGVSLADITGSNPATGSCICLSGSGVNIRSSACGTVIGTGSTGDCYTYSGVKEGCYLSGVYYEYFKLNYGSSGGWIAGTYLNTASAASCSAPVGGGFTYDCMKCICQIESGCDENIGCRWDVNSYSCGPYQIKEPYYIDCGSPGSGWEACANDLTCAETCVQAYMDRYGEYCAGANPVCEDYARIHNGGPMGCTSSATEGYWDKVMACCGCQTCCD